MTHTVSDLVSDGDRLREKLLPEEAVDKYAA